MKFVFDRDPTNVQNRLEDLKTDLAKMFQLKFHLYDTEFYSQVDGSIDFGRTSSCFQVVNGDSVIDAQKLLDASSNRQFAALMDEYEIVDVERCAKVVSTSRVDWVQICLLAIAALIGLLALAASIAVCCLYGRYKRQLRRHAPIKIVEAPVRTFLPTSLPPGSVAGGENPRVVYDWQESTIPMDAASYRSLPNQ